MTTQPKNSRNVWDINAEYRHIQILSGKDLSYNYVLWPTIQLLLDGVKLGKLLDGGCGSGIISSRLASIGWNVCGLDNSFSMIKIARREFGASQNLQFIKGSRNSSGQQGLSNVDKPSKVRV